MVMDSVGLQRFSESAQNSVNFTQIREFEEWDDTTRKNQVLQQLFDIHARSSHPEEGSWSFLNPCINKDWGNKLLLACSWDKSKKVTQIHGYALYTQGVVGHVLAYLVVDPNERRKGLGRRLVSEVLERQSEPLFVYVRAQNYPAISLYESFRQQGYSVTAERLLHNSYYNGDGMIRYRIASYGSVGLYDYRIGSWGSSHTANQARSYLNDLLGMPSQIANKSE